MSVPPPVLGVLDTGVLRDIRNSHSPAVAFLLACLKSGPVRSSELSAMKLLTEAADAKNAASIRYFLKGCVLLPISAKISKRAYKLIQSLTPPSPLTPDDALIAATALFHKLPLYTLDPAKFGIDRGLVALQPY